MSKPSRKAAKEAEAVRSRKLPLRKKTSEDRLLLIDADIFAYQAVEEALQEINTRDDEWSYVVDLAQVKDALETRMNETMIALEARDLILAFGSVENWRTKVMPEYKANRKGRRKPLGYRACVEWMKSRWRAESKPGLEADDLLGIWATDPNFEPSKTKIIVSEDKDFKGVPGKLWNPRRPEEGIVDVSKEQALHFFMTQVLTGDSTDGYKGCPGMGPVKAELALSAAKTPAEKWDAVVNCFVQAKLSEEDALRNARVARILRHGEVDARGKPILWEPPKPLKIGKKKGGKG